MTTVARTLRDLGWGPDRTRSDLERRSLQICRQQGIPKPEVIVTVGPYEVDFLWRPERLIVEVDGYSYHSDRAAFRSDRARDRYLDQHGFVVRRYSDVELDEQPSALATHLHERLRQRARQLMQ